MVWWCGTSWGGGGVGGVVWRWGGGVVGWYVVSLDGAARRGGGHLDKHVQMWLRRGLIYCEDCADACGGRADRGRRELAGTSSKEEATMLRVGDGPVGGRSERDSSVDKQKELGNWIALTHHLHALLVRPLPREEAVCNRAEWDGTIT